MVTGLRLFYRTVRHRGIDIVKHKTQLIALLQKQLTINVIDVTEGKPASLFEKIRSLKDPNLTVIIIKSR